MVNMKTSREKNAARITASLFRSLGQPTRLRILQAIGYQEVCVCHLESVLGLRQAYISQHLMALRDQGLVTTRRDGKFIFYRLQSTELLNLIQDASNLAGVNMSNSVSTSRDVLCNCPSCATENETLLPVENTVD